MTRWGLVVDFKKLDDDYVAALAMELAKLPKIGLKASVNRKVSGKVSIYGNAHGINGLAH